MALGPMRAPERNCVPMSFGTPSTAKSLRGSLLKSVQSLRGGYLGKQRGSLFESASKDPAKGYIMVYLHQNMVSTLSVQFQDCS